MQHLDSAIEYAQTHSDDFLEALKSLLRIPSISALSEYQDEIERAARWLVETLKDYGFEDAAIFPTEKHPIVFGSHMKAGPEAPTLLVYGHYDVQPIDPLDEWESDPFEPEVRGDHLFARGASDMKGQIIAHFKAMESFLAVDGLPINIKYFIEGEEEIGSPNLDKFVRANRELLECDFCLNTDSGILGANTPSLIYGLRGIAYFEIWLTGPASDLHSGSFGGAVENPANVLCQLIAGMKDSDGRITLPGFYDSVHELGPKERGELAKLPQTEAWWLEQSGAPALNGEAGFTITERATARPTLDVNGIYSGFIEEGQKTVLPSKAFAKVSTRLVPDQRPEEIHRSFEAYLNENAPPTVEWELKMLSGALPGKIDLESKPVQAAGEALEMVWDKAPLYNRIGGTVPIVGILQEILGVSSLMLGFGLPDDNLHAPNEKFYLPNFYRGIETHIRFMHLIAE
jgi:acetylornithine deacetylase/succinyl-diaminopimelate desuccinylase-like protein